MIDTNGVEIHEGDRLVLNRLRGGIFGTQADIVHVKHAEELYVFVSHDHNRNLVGAGFCINNSSQVEVMTPEIEFLVRLME